MLKIIIALTLISQSYAYLNTSPEDSLSDIFPLEVGKKWIYSFKIEQVTNNVSRKDTGYVEYRVINRNPGNESTIWQIKKIRSFYTYGYFMGQYTKTLVIDSGYFNIVELHSERHKLYTPVFDPLSGFPFFNTSIESEIFYRYLQTDYNGYAYLDLTDDTLSFSAFRANYTVAKDTGIIKLNTFKFIGFPNIFDRTEYILQRQMDTLILSTDVYNTLAKKYLLLQNFPNPFNPVTKISYQIPSMGLVQLSIYDILGKEITSLVNEEKPAGNYDVEFNANDLSSGVYFYRLQVYPANGGRGNFVETKKMILLR